MRSHYVGSLRGDGRGGTRHDEALGGGAEGLHATGNEADHPCVEVVLKSILLDFSSFPFKVHSAVNIEAWVRASLANYGLQLEDFHLFVPDGASNGTKALKLLKALYRVCAAHDLQMSASHAAGNGSKVRPPPLSLPVSCTSLDPRCRCCALVQVSKNSEIKALERKNSHIAARVHLSTKTTKILQEV